MESEVNLYDILEINYTSSKEEIKNAYKKLALKFHPDKNIETKDKFIIIKNAYDVLIDDEKKANYDRHLYMNKFLLKKILTIVSDDKKYLHEINNNNYKSAFYHLFNRYSKKYNNNIKKLNIIDNIYCDVSDRYNDNYMLVEIIRKTRDNIKLYVPLRNYKNIFYDEGEIDEFGNIGNLILYTKITNKNFICKNGDIIMKVSNDNNINKIIYINGVILDVIKNKQDKYIVYENMGLIFGEKRGNLIMKFV